MKYEHGFWWVHSWWHQFRRWRVMLQINPFSWVIGIAGGKSVLCFYFGPLCITVFEWSKDEPQ